LDVIGGVRPAVSGDFNNNGVVDAADYVLWRNGGPLQNEIDNPGTVDDADYTSWQARFGAVSASGAALASATVPEPAGALVAFVIWLYLAAARTSRYR
jgi:hypothetical protein